MADKNGLQMIGWTFGGITAAVMLIAAILVLNALANPAARDERPSYASYATGQTQ